MQVPILSYTQISHKLKRMAYEIWEANSGEEEVIIFGIAEGGAVLAAALKHILDQESDLKTSLEILRFDKSRVSSFRYSPEHDISGKSIVLVDDVANSGKTLLYAMKPLLDFEPKRIQLTVLVDRKHKNYPVVPDVIGYSVASTLQEHIRVTFEGDKITGAYLE
ncbi:MAG TPA: phosphoribosyltransferase family protein [Edaphocola sp.]|nr:phosphoribosyltransferase family protein [Edaphocola sp.]